MLSEPLDDRLRDEPTPEFVREMRDLYPTEAEIDRVLTLKMEKRPQAARQGFALDELVACTEKMLAERTSGAFEISGARWLSGGASKMQVAFHLRWHDEGGVEQEHEMVLRMEPSESLNATSRPREFELLRAFEGVLPVPRAFWLDDDARWYPEPAIVYEFASGVTKPSDAPTRVSGLGQAFDPALRARLGPQFVEHLARVHTFDYSRAELPSFEVPAEGSTESALLQLNRALRVWDEDRGHDQPIFDVAVNWLRRNLPVLDTPSVLHGDFRAGNFLFDESTSQISSWLDWERGYIGDRHRDLAWTTTQSFGNFAEDGSTFLVSGLVPIDEFFASYERLSGLTVDHERIRFYRVLNSLQLMVSALATAYRVVRLGKTHQDVLIAYVEGVGYAEAEVLRRVLEEEI